VIEKKGSAFGLNKQYFISQGQFANIPVNKKDSDIKSIIDYVWEYRISSLLREYMRGQEEDDIKRFITECYGVFVKENAEDNENSAGDEVEADGNNQS
jgi:hypothetical protein